MTQQLLRITYDAALIRLNLIFESQKKIVYKLDWRNHRNGCQRPNSWEHFFAILHWKIEKAYLIASKQQYYF